MRDEIYICLLNGYVGSFNPASWEIKYAQRNKFTDFIQETIRRYPNAQLRCVLNEGLEKTILDKIEYDKRILSGSKNAERI